MSKNRWSTNPDVGGGTNRRLPRCSHRPKSGRPSGLWRFEVQLLGLFHISLKIIVIGQRKLTRSQPVNVLSQVMSVHPKRARL